MKRVLLGLLGMGTLVAYGCLPGDSRPEPGHVYLSAEASAATVEGFSTDDGWTIRFEKLLVGLGNVQLAGDPCNTYANAGYDRLFNFTQAGAQKLGEVYGLDGCEIRFRLRPPSDDSLLQNGVTAADREFMRKLNVIGDISELPTEGPPPRTAVYARGTATRNSLIKHFDWKFIARYTLTDCANVIDGERNTFLHLKGGDDLRPILSFHGEDLFLDGISVDATRRFDALAAADANADGQVTLEELVMLPAPMIALDGGIADAGPMIPTTPTLPTLAGWAGFMTERLLPLMVQYDGNPCQVFNDRGFGGGDGPF
jgi:hypothetical protein